MNDHELPPLTQQGQALYSLARQLFPFAPTDEQDEVLTDLCRFATDRLPRDVFVLNGFAGTGKTTLMGAYVNALRRAGAKVVLLAPTGRAAKVFSNSSTLPAGTIHRRLFRPTEQGGYTLAPNRSEDTLFVVDEASLIGDAPDLRRSLLQMLVRYVNQGSNCGLILMGDTAQLPPVGQEQSVAMNRDRLVSLGLAPWHHVLSTPLRQAAESGVLYNATLVRRFITGEPHPESLILEASRFPDDVTVVPGEELEDYYTSSLSRVGHDGTIVITRSNWRANLINNDIRVRILDTEEEIGSGEHILVTRNNYYWARQERNALLANGDMATVNWIGQAEERYGYRFADAELTFPGRQGPVAAKLMLSTLYTDTPNLSPRAMADFHGKVLYSYEGDLSEKMRQADNDPYYNALQVKHAYCVTCHKAQGGQWRHVYIDMAGIRTDAFGEDFYRWLYTALTRSTERVFLINPTLPVT